MKAASKDVNAVGSGDAIRWCRNARRNLVVYSGALETASFPGSISFNRRPGTMRPLAKKGVLGIVLGAAGFVMTPSSSAAQGCEPIRFTTPVDLAGEGEVYRSVQRWRLTLAYRRLSSDNWLVGTTPSSARAPGGEAPRIKIHTLVADVSYSLTDRLQISASLPFSAGTLSRVWDDSARHEQSARGIGDLSVRGDFLLLSPRTHPNGNLSLGLGFKAPTGSHTKPSQSYTATGPVPFPADIFIQPGDGGWGITLGAQAFARVMEGMFAYASGSYMASPKVQS